MDQKISFSSSPKISSQFEETQPRDTTAYTQEWIDETVDVGVEQEIIELDLERKFKHEQGLTTRLYDACLQTFKELCLENAKPSPASKDLDSEDKCSTGSDLSSNELRMKRNLKNQMARLFLWGEGFSDGRLDKALDLSDELKCLVLQLLCDLSLELQKRKWLWCSSPAHSYATEAVKKLNLLVDQSRTVIARDTAKSVRENENDMSTISSITSGYELSDEEASETSYDLDSTIQSLMNLAPAIENNLIQANLKNMSPSNIKNFAFNVSKSAQGYVSHVRDKFPNAPGRLVERLGEANWQRHHVVRAKMYKKRLVSEDKEGTLAEFQPKSVFHDSGLGTTVTASSSYAASMASHTSFLSSVAEREEGSLRVPPTPVEISAGKPFTCFICGHTQSKLKNRVDWKMHVFADLQPYICTSPTCNQQLAQFSDRKAWAEHEFNEHYQVQVWECWRCSAEYKDDQLLREHLQATHEDISAVVEADPQFLIDLSIHPGKRPIAENSCPICQTSTTYTRREYVKHVSRHMEEIALMVLPKEDGDATDVLDDTSASSQVSNQDRPLSARRDPRYQSKPGKDGLYRCPFKDGGEMCDQQPFRLKCNYDKHLDSHLKPYRCKQQGCAENPFASTACLLRHEREAHEMHNYKEVLCQFKDCERSIPGKGLPRKWNAHDHMKRVHRYTQPGASSPDQSTNFSKAKKGVSKQYLKTRTPVLGSPQDI